MKDRNTLTQTIVAYSFNLVMLILTFILMQDHTLFMLALGLFAGIAYWIYTIAANFRSHMPWLAYIHFVIGALVQGLLNWFSVVPPDGGELVGAGQMVYCFEIGALVGAVGITGFIMQVLREVRKPLAPKRSAAT